MNALRKTFCSVLWSALAVAGLAAASTATGQELSQLDDTSVTYLTRGPLHEAYAAVAPNDATPGLIVPDRPPDPIAEVPPEYGPEGEGYLWIPGYWAWDEEYNDFIWISGAWRLPPPGKQWVPGYWAETQLGFQWVPGFWQIVQDTGQVALEYLPSPKPEGRPEQPSTHRRLLLDPRLLGMRQRPIRLANRLLGPDHRRLGLDPAAIRLDPVRLPVHPRLLGPSPPPARPLLCTGLLPPNRDCQTPHPLCAFRGAEHGRAAGPSVLPPGNLPLLLRRLLRSALPRPRNRALPRVPLHSLRLRSALRL
jgi:hypothetical protein